MKISKEHLQTTKTRTANYGAFFCCVMLIFLFLGDAFLYADIFHQRAREKLIICYLHMSSVAQAKLAQMCYFFFFFFNKPSIHVFSLCSLGYRTYVTSSQTRLDLLCFETCGMRRFSKASCFGCWFLYLVRSVMVFYLVRSCRFGALRLRFAVSGLRWAILKHIVQILAVGV